MKEMMRPMQLGGKEIIFGEGTLQHLSVIPAQRVTIVIGGSSVKKNGTLDAITAILKQRQVPWNLIEGIDDEPLWSQVCQGADLMHAFLPDLIVAVGGGSVMDGAKAMWVVYEHPELTELSQIVSAKPFPVLRTKARMCCIPTTSGTASEVSRSVVITDDESGMKQGIGNMEMMPDYAICDPVLTLSMPPHITASTGMDALTHAVEAYVSKRANIVADVLAEAAITMIVKWLPVAFENGDNMEARENMLVASMIAGMSFTNVSLGITHSFSHTLGGHFHLPHGLLNAIILPYVIDFNRQDPEAAKRYDKLAQLCSADDFAQLVRDLNQRLGIQARLHELIPDKERFDSLNRMMSDMTKADGCTKTNPIIPSVEAIGVLFEQMY